MWCWIQKNYIFIRQRSFHKNKKLLWCWRLLFMLFPKLCSDGFCWRPKHMLDPRVLCRGWDNNSNVSDGWGSLQCRQFLCLGISAKSAESWCLKEVARIQCLAWVLFCIGGCEWVTVWWLGCLAWWWEHWAALWPQTLDRQPGQPGLPIQY